MSARTRFWRAVVPAAAAITVAGVLQGASGGAPAFGQEAPPAPPTTANPVQQLLEGLLGGGTTTTVAPPAAPPPATGGPEAQGAGTPVAPPPGPGSGDGNDPNQPQSVPPDAQALIDSIQRTGGRSTSELMGMLRQLEQVGYTEAEAAAMGMGHFPVAGEAAWSDDFLYPRFNPTFHLHQGNDIFCARGTPIRAPDDGSVRFGEDPGGGKAAYVTRGDGTYYYMAHLDAYADVPGAGVKQGQIVGYCGDTGNATGGATHLHFEIHPGGGAAINPKPILDHWLDEAMAAAPALLESYRINLPQALLATGQLRRFDQFESIVPGADADTLLWASSVSPSGGALKMAQLRAANAAGKVDWDSVVGNQHATADDWQRAQDLTHALLAPVTPGPLQQVLAGGAS